MPKKPYTKPAIKTIKRPATVQDNSPESEQKPPAIAGDNPNEGK